MDDRLSKAKLSQLRNLQRKKQRGIEGKFLCEGWHLLEEALDAGRDLSVLVFEEDAEFDENERRLLNRARLSAEEIYCANKDQLDRISETKQCQGVVFTTDLVSLDADALLEQCLDSAVSRLVAMDAVSDPGNCGTILRSAAWFGLNGAILGFGTAEVENGKTARASMGAIFSLPTVQRVALVEVLERLKGEGYAVVSTELDGAQNVHEYDWPEKCVLVVGNEARGVSADVSKLSDTRLRIPSFGSGESLNAAVASSIAMSEWRRRMP